MLVEHQVIMMELDNSSFIRQMPKIELHAHLSGSISKQTVRELIDLHQKNLPNETIPNNVIKAFKVTEEECDETSHKPSAELKATDDENERMS